MKKCKVCKNSFKPTYSSVQMVCSVECGYKYAQKNTKKVIKENKSKLNKRKNDLKTLGQHLNELQVLFNTWIRLRDKGLLCISCQKPCKKENAGHFRSVGNCPSLRFESLNVHLQCEYCNTYQHGNLLKYRKNLISKIGLDKVEWLELEHEPKKYLISDIEDLKKLYRMKIKDLK